MSFFEAPQPFEPPEPPPQPEWAEPPAHVVGATVGVDPVVLVETDELVIAVSNLVAYGSGLEFDVAVLRRHRRAEGMPSLFGQGPHGQVSDEGLRFGVEFADGRKATNTRMHIPYGGGRTMRLDRAFSAEEPVAPVLRPRGGGGNGTRYNHTFWLWPLPPSGPLAFVCEWPAASVAETRAEIDVAPILAAAVRARVFWASS